MERGDDPLLNAAGGGGGAVQIIGDTGEYGVADVAGGASGAPGEPINVAQEIGAGAVPGADAAGGGGGGGGGADAAGGGAGGGGGGAPPGGGGGGGGGDGGEGGGDGGGGGGGGGAGDGFQRGRDEFDNIYEGAGRTEVPYDLLRTLIPALMGRSQVESLANPFTTGGPRGIGADPLSTRDYLKATGKAGRVYDEAGFGGRNLALQGTISRLYTAADKLNVESSRQRNYAKEFANKPWRTMTKAVYDAYRAMGLGTLAVQLYQLGLNPQKIEDLVRNIGERTDSFHRRLNASEPLTSFMRELGNQPVNATVAGLNAAASVGGTVWALHNPYHAAAAACAAMGINWERFQENINNIGDVGWWNNIMANSEMVWIWAWNTVAAAVGLVAPYFVGNIVQGAGGIMNPAAGVQMQMMDGVGAIPDEADWAAGAGAQFPMPQLGLKMGGPLPTDVNLVHPKTGQLIGQAHAGETVVPSPDTIMITDVAQLTEGMKQHAALIECAKQFIDYKARQKDIKRLQRARLTSEQEKIFEAIVKVTPLAHNLENPTQLDLLHVYDMAAYSFCGPMVEARLFGSVLKKPTTQIDPNTMSPMVDVGTLEDELHVGPRPPKRRRLKPPGNIGNLYAVPEPHKSFQELKEEKVGFQPYVDRLGHQKNTALRHAGTGDTSANKLVLRT